MNCSDFFYNEFKLQISNTVIDALEDTMVLQIHFENLTGLYDQSAKFNRIFSLPKSKILRKVSFFDNFYKNNPHIINYKHV